MKGYKSPCSEQTKRHKTDPLNSFYIYIHSRQSDGKPFYVGKGCGYRAWVFKGRNNWWHKMHDKHGVDVEILFDGLTAEESYSTEKDVILELEYFGYHLVNLTSGVMVDIQSPLRQERNNPKPRLVYFAELIIHMQI